MHRRPLTVLFLFTCLLFCSPAFAQQETATITGIVRDPSGAVVPKATVTVTNIQTNISVKTETDDEGAYIIPSLRPGEYSVTAESSGFSEDRPNRRHPAGRAGRAHRRHAAVGSAHRDGRSRRRHAAARHADVVARTGHRPEEDRRAAAERPRLQPARAALARRAAGHAPAGERELQGRAQRQRQPHVQQRLPARRRGQHLVLELLPRRERAARAAVDRGAAGVQDPDQRLFGGVRPQLRRGRQRHDQVRHQHACAAASTSSCATTRSMPTTSSRTRWTRRSRSASATSSAARSAARSSGTGRSGSATTRGCAIRKASRACGWCRRRRRRPACSARVVVDPFAAGRPSFQPERAGPVGDPARPLGSGRRRHRRADSGSERARTRRSTRRRRSPTPRRISSTSASITSSSRA